MFKCPNCANKEILWMSDQDNGEETWTVYYCENCDNEFIEKWDMNR